MRRAASELTRAWIALGPRFLPFADATSTALPVSRLLRLSLFQVSVGMAIVLLNGTLNRVMVLELDVPAWLVSLMVALPLLFAPLRALIGHRSDHHRCYLGWRRVPFLWMGSMAQFGGLAIMPFALLVLSGDTHGPMWVAYLATALAFLLTGAGLHTTQTAGLALATDLAPEGSRPRVVALLYVMLLIGMVVSSIGFAALLDNFSQLRLIQVIQGAALVTIALNVVALWQQETRNPARTAPHLPRPPFRETWNAFKGHGNAVRLLVAVGLGTAGFSMQDILLEPYGGEVLGLSVAATTGLTAILAAGMLAAFVLASRWLGRGADPIRVAGLGALVGLFAFAAVILASPLGSALLFRVGTGLIGFGGGLFAVGTLIAAMALTEHTESGIALGAWGAVQATAAGIAIAAGGAIRDVATQLAANGSLGPALSGPATGYGIVYHTEIGLLFATLVAIGPLVRRPGDLGDQQAALGLPDFPG
ncbi:MAG: BCD family MFS transporter [Gammaproteobacteria bacterium]|nr:BCD family MFS transporter [Gammaproteobacteria bacterium]